MGGVLLRTEDQTPRQLWAERLGISLEELYAAVFGGQASQLAYLGKGPVEAVWRNLADQYDLTEPERRQLERAFWSGDQVDHELIRFVRSLRPRYKTALLSNAWPDVRGFIEDQWHFADAFDELVISAEVGVTKPDPRVYLLTMDRLGLPAEAAVFVDDFQENVEGARQVGMQAIHFRSPEQAIEELTALLELPADS